MYFTRETTANDYDCDYSNRLKISSAMRYMQQTSAEHLNSIGLPYEKLYAENMVFLLSKSCIKAYGMPAAGQKIVVGTAAVATKGARFIREFIIDDMQGNRLVSAITMWLLVDPLTRKIMRPSSFPYNINFQDSEIDDKIFDIQFPKTISESDESEIAIRYSHIDYNNHVNNSVYADFVCDAIPIGAFNEKSIDTMVINYHNEAKWGDVLKVRINKAPSGEFHITGQKNGAEPCFEAMVLL